MKQRQYVIELGSALGVYAVLLFGSIWAVRTFEVTGGLRIALYLAPLLGVAAGLRAIVRFHRRIDELQQKIALEALSIAFAGTAFATLTWGFLEMAGLPRLSMFCVWPVMGTLQVVGLLVARRRYR